MIGRIIAESTMPAVKMVPPPARETLPCLNKNSHPRLRFRNAANGWIFGASTKIPHSPKMIDGTAASRSTIAANGRASRFGAYWVRNTAIPTAIGTASSSALTELSTVTMNKSRMPNARWSAFVVLNSALVKKLAWFARNDGTARTNRKIAISAIAITIVKPAAAASDLNSRSSRRVLWPSAGFGTVGFVPVDVLTSGPEATTTSDSRDGIDRRHQPQLPSVRNGDISVVGQAILSGTDGALQERLHGHTDLRIRILRADDLVGRQHDRIGAGLRRLVERLRVEDQVVPLSRDPGPGNRLAD